MNSFPPSLRVRTSFSIIVNAFISFLLHAICVLNIIRVHYWWYWNSYYFYYSYQYYCDNQLDRPNLKKSKGTLLNMTFLFIFCNNYIAIFARLAYIFQYIIPQWRRSKVPSLIIAFNTKINYRSTLDSVSTMVPNRLITRYYAFKINYNFKVSR
jgi:hypothetical protein